MRHLALATLPTVATTERGLTYTYRWPDLSITCSELPKNRMAAQLDGLVQYVRSVQGGKLDGRGERIVGRILKTRLVAGIEIDPQRDAAGRAEEVLGKLAFGLRPIIFFGNALYDWNSRRLLGPDASFDPASEL